MHNISQYVYVIMYTSMHASIRAHIHLVVCTCIHPSIQARRQTYTHTSFYVYIDIRSDFKQGRLLLFGQVLVRADVLFPHLIDG